MIDNRYTEQEATDGAETEDKEPLDPRTIADLNQSILHATEIQNRIRKIKQLELSPLIDNYGSLNAPHAHPSGLMNGLSNTYGQRFETV